MKPTVNIFWFRRDLRLQDNAGLYYALKSSHPIIPLFIFDRNILDELEEKLTEGWNSFISPCRIYSNNW